MIGAETVTVQIRTGGGIGSDGRAAAPTVVEHTMQATWEPVPGGTSTLDNDGQRRQIMGTWIVWATTPVIRSPLQGTAIIGDRIIHDGVTYEAVGQTSYNVVIPHQEIQVKRVYE